MNTINNPEPCRRLNEDIYVWFNRVMSADQKRTAYITGIETLLLLSCLTQWKTARGAIHYLASPSVPVAFLKWCVYGNRGSMSPKEILRNIGFDANEFRVAATPDIMPQEELEAMLKKKEGMK